MIEVLFLYLLIFLVNILTFSSLRQQAELRLLFDCRRQQTESLAVAEKITVFKIRFLGFYRTAATQVHATSPIWPGSPPCAARPSSRRSARAERRKGDTVIASAEADIDRISESESPSHSHFQPLENSGGFRNKLLGVRYLKFLANQVSTK